MALKKRTIDNSFKLLSPKLYSKKTNTANTLRKIAKYTFKYL